MLFRVGFQLWNDRKSMGVRAVLLYTTIRSNTEVTDRTERPESRFRGSMHVIRFDVDLALGWSF